MSRFDAEVFEALRAVEPVDFAKATEIAERFGEKPKAIVAACTRAGITYKRKARVSKTGEPVVTKADLVTAIAEALDLDVEKLDGLDKATKTVLETLVAAVEGE